MGQYSGMRAVIYSRVPFNILESHDDHIIPIIRWCREQNVKVVGEFTDEDDCDGLRRCADLVSKGGVNLLLVDSMEILTELDPKDYEIVRRMKSLGVSLLRIQNGDASLINRISDYLNRKYLRRVIDNFPLLPFTEDEDEDEDDVVDVKPEVEQTEDTITFVFNVPKGIREFTIRIREVDE